MHLCGRCRVHTVDFSFCPAILENDLLLLDCLTLLRLQMYLLPTTWLPVCHITHGLVRAKRVFTPIYTATLASIGPMFAQCTTTHTHTQSTRRRWTTSMYIMSQRLIATLFNVGKLIVNKYAAESMNWLQDVLATKAFANCVQNVFANNQDAYISVLYCRGWSTLMCLLVEPVQAATVLRTCLRSADPTNRTL